LSLAVGLLVANVMGFLLGEWHAAGPAAAAGAEMVALDCTARGQRYDALDRLRRIRAELRVPVLADIATVEEAVSGATAGADAVLSTMRGYTDETAQVQAFEPEFIATLSRAVDVPVIAEGRIHSPEQAVQALDAGAFAVIVGTAITRPHEIARGFVEAMRRAAQPLFFLGIDLGGTNTKFGVVSSKGALTHEAFVPTPAAAGRAVLLEHLKQVAGQCLETARKAGIQPAALGVATAGWVDHRTGQVVYATENLPGWTGTPIATELEPALRLPGGRGE
jgi:tRNA-dihydrouridine synthase